MAIIEWPEEVQTLYALECLVCSRRVRATDITIGVVIAGNRQYCTCSLHLGRGESTRFVRAWVDFLVLQQDTAKQP